MSEKKKPTLEELLEKCNGENPHPEIFPDTQGREEIYELGDIVEIVLDCPFKGLQGVLTYLSDDSSQIEVLIGYDGFKGDIECSSYFRGFAENLKKIKSQTLMNSTKRRCNRRSD